MHARHLAQPDSVDFFWRQIGRGIEGESFGVEGIALRMLPHAVFGRGTPRLFFQSGDQASIGRRHAIYQRLAAGRQQRFAP